MIKSIHWAWVILLTSFFTLFIHYSIRLGYAILMPEMILSLKITKAQAGTIASSFYLAYGIFSPILGFMVDRFNVRFLLVIFSCILATGTLSMGKAQTLFQARLSFFLVGVGASAMWVPVVTLVQRWFGTHRRGMALGILSVSYAIGYGVMGLILPPLVAGFGWQTCWFLLAGFAFLLAPLNGIFLRNRPQDLHLGPWGEAPEPPRNNAPWALKTKVSFRKLLGYPSLWLAGISYLFIAFAAYLVNIFIVTYGTLELRFPYARAARLASAIAFSGIAGAFLLLFLSDFIGRKKTLIIISVSMTLSIFLIIWAGNRWTALIPAVCIFGVFYAAAWPIYAAVAADLFPREYIRVSYGGTFVGFSQIIYGLALVLAPALGGYIADVTGTFIYSFLAGIISGCLATLFFLPIKKF
jgi:sugar phosphate permease